MIVFYHWGNSVVCVLDYLADQSCTLCDSLHSSIMSVNKDLSAGNSFSLIRNINPLIKKSSLFQFKILNFSKLSRVITNLDLSVRLSFFILIRIREKKDTRMFLKIFHFLGKFTAESDFSWFFSSFLRSSPLPLCLECRGWASWDYFLMNFWKYQ